MHFTIRRLLLMLGTSDLASVPGEFYGTSAGSTFCPVRDVVLGVLATNQILLSWAVLFMRHRETALRGFNPNCELSLLRRRALTYRLMRDKLADVQYAVSEDAMYGLAFSALLESRTGDLGTAQRHLKGCLLIRQQRIDQGLRVLSHPLATVCSLVCLQVGVPDYFESLRRVRQAGLQLKETFQAIRDWKRTLTESWQLDPEGLSLLSVDRFDLSDHAQQLKNDLQRHLMRAQADSTTTGMRLYLALLFILTIATWKFANHADVSVEFLQLLTKCFNEGTSPHGPQSKEITTLGMLYITFRVIDQVYVSMSAPAQNVDLWQVVDMVELLRPAPPSCCARVRKQLLIWLVGRVETASEASPCDDIFQQHVVEDLEAAWLARQGVLTTNHV
jgi:hypothetical protein